MNAKKRTRRGPFVSRFRCHASVCLLPLLVSSASACEPREPEPDAVAQPAGQETRPLERTEPAPTTTTTTEAPPPTPKPVPRFEDYPALEILDQSPAKIDFSNLPDMRSFRTRIGAALSMKPNFAGKYMLIEWGCGTNCSSNVLVDATNGKLLNAPSPCGAGIEYRRESRLIIVDPTDALTGGGVPLACDTTSYYVMDGGEMRLLERRKVR